AVQDLKGLGYEKGKPVGLVGVTELSEAQKKQLKEQQEMQQMYDMIMKHKRAMQEMQLMWEKAIQQHQHGYDSDEEVDSELGTWEHQLRRMEMDKTRGEGLQQGHTPRGTPQLAIPGGVWRGFCSCCKPSPAAIPACPACCASTSDSGRGSREGEDVEGPLSPLSVLPPRGTTAVDGAGFGIDRPAELTKEDDEYEAFRKRMMLAYRFRPNPLVRGHRGAG
ncbi:SUGP1 protein, partial [Xiphorhynchus elegans]|nr:SUGP1 protein [Xiphorhynchus elegans]